MSLHTSKVDLRLQTMQRNFYRDAQFWKRFGGVLGAVYMKPNHEKFELDLVGQYHSMMRRSIYFGRYFKPPFPNRPHAQAPEPSQLYAALTQATWRSEPPRVLSSASA